MLYQVMALAMAVGCTSTPKAQPGWGIMTSAGSAPAIYALTEWRPGTKLRAYQLNGMTESIQVSVAASSRDPDSPMHGPGTGNASWRHSVAEPQKVPQGAMWVCLPVDWIVHPSGPNQATLRTPGGGSGSMTSALRQEGIEVVVEMESSRVKLYFYFGYDVSPAPSSP
jgi:hypothetical protein